MRFNKSGVQQVRNPAVFEQAVNFNGVVAGKGGISSPIWREAPNPALCDPNYCYGFFDDFMEGYITTMKNWTTTGGTAAINEALVGGVVSLATTNVDNDAALIARTHEEFCVHAGKKIYFEARVKMAEANVDDCNVFVGMTQGTVADAVPLLDDGGGAGEIIADDDAICFAKKDGGTTWVTYSADGAAAYESTAVDTRGTDWVRLGFIADPSIIYYYIDGHLVATHSTTLPTADEEMTLCIGVKAGDTNIETLLVDWVKCVALR